MATIDTTVTASPAQYVYAVSRFGLNPAKPGNGKPAPPPIEENRSMTSMIVAASTHVAIAKYPLRSLETSHHSGRATTPQPTAATGSAANGEIPLIARISTK